MTTTTFTHAPVAHTSLFERLGAWAHQFVKSVEYSQMLRALAQLDDEKLAKIGVARRDIPAYAHKLVYKSA